MNKPDDSSTPDPAVSPVDEPTKDQLESTDAKPAEDDDLPEYEPLTPELVEDEAIRGDFMLQWAAILLGMLLAWTVIDRTEILVHVKTGQYLLSNGVLPPETDVFSATAEGRPWVNLSWLWDLVLGLIYNVSGATGLSLLSAAIAFVMFWLVSRLTLPGVSTWWGSVCAVLAALACFPSLTVTSHIATLLGITVTLWLLYRWQWDSKHSLWPIVGVFLLWGNLDGRAWIGGVLLLAFTLGAWMDSFRTLPSDARKLSLQTLGSVTLASLFALLVHPFLWETWFSPYWLYSVEYPVLREYVTNDLPFAFERFPAVAPRFWRDLGYFNSSALLLMVISSVTLLLNRERLRLSTAFSLLALNLIGIAGGRELAVASLVNAVIATVNGQEWYRANFRQTYTLDPGELLWSRGGRALTVLSIFALAFATVSGHLMGANGRRVGMGFSPQLAGQLESYASIMDDAFDDRAFNFRLQQGDVLIWSGWKPFVDSRVRLYGGDESLTVLHQDTRLRMRSREPQYAEMDQETWANVFNEFDIHQTMPRLTGIAPDYITYYDLMMSPSWQLTSQGAATAIFTRTDSPDPEVADYLQSHDNSSYVRSFLRTEAEETEEVFSRGVWPQAPSFYDSVLFLQNKVVSNETRIAEHYNVLRGVVLSRQEVGVAIALAYGAIRNAREGLRDNPNSVTGYRVLAEAYQFLNEIETAFQANKNLPHPHPCRYYQVIAANHQVLDCAPEDVNARYELFEMYLSQGRFDLALKYLQEVQTMTGETTILSPAHQQHNTQLQENDARLLGLQERFNAMRLQVDTAMQSQANRVLVAQSTYAAGFPAIALEILEGDLTVVATNPAAQMLMGILLLEVGRTEEALTQIEQLRPTPIKTQSPDWPKMAAYCNHAADELLAAKRTLEESEEFVQDMIATALLESAPLRFIGPHSTPEGGLQWSEGELMAPMRQVQTATALTTSIAARLETNELFQALLAIELGKIEEALALFDSIIKRQPDSPARPMIEFYVRLLDGPPLSPLEESVSSDSDQEVFTDEAPSDSQPAEQEDAAGTSSPDPDLTTLPPGEDALKSRRLVPDDDGDEARE